MLTNCGQKYYSSQNNLVSYRIDENQLHDGSFSVLNTVVTC